MQAYRVNISSDNEPEKCLGYNIHLRTAQIRAKEYIKKYSAVNETWSPEQNQVQFLIGEELWKINFEEINIEF